MFPEVHRTRRRSVTVYLEILVAFQRTDVAKYMEKQFLLCMVLFPRSVCPLGSSSLCLLSLNVIEPRIMSIHCWIECFPDTISAMSSILILMPALRNCQNF